MNIKDTNGRIPKEGDVVLIKGRNEYPKFVEEISGVLGVRLDSGKFQTLFELSEYDRSFTILGEAGK